MPVAYLTIDEILTLLGENPGRIAALTSDLTAVQLVTVSSKNGWSAAEILAHLRSCADVWGDCMRSIIARDRPTIRAVNPRTWINGTHYPKLKFRSSFQDYERQRVELLKFLQSLPRKSWDRTAIVLGAGRPLEKAVHYYADRMARHERTHVKQIARIASALHKRER